MCRHISDISTLRHFPLNTPWRCISAWTRQSHSKGRRNSMVGKKDNSFIFYRSLHTQYHRLINRNTSSCFLKHEAWPSRTDDQNISLHIHYYIKLYKIFFFCFVFTTENKFRDSPITKLGSDLITNRSAERPNLLDADQTDSRSVKLWSTILHVCKPFKLESPQHLPQYNRDKPDLNSERPTRFLYKKGTRIILYSSYA